MAITITCIICGTFAFLMLAVMFTAVAVAKKMPQPVPPTLDEIFESARKIGLGEFK